MNRQEAKTRSCTVSGLYDGDKIEVIDPITGKVIESAKIVIDPFTTKLVYILDEPEDIMAELKGESVGV